MKRFVISNGHTTVPSVYRVSAATQAKALEYLSDSDSSAVRFAIGGEVECREEGKELGTLYERSASGWKRRGAAKLVPARVIPSAANWFDRWRAAKAKADALGHIAVQQSGAVECCKCTKSGYITDLTEASGTIFSERCGS